MRCLYIISETDRTPDNCLVDIEPASTILLNPMFTDKERAAMIQNPPPASAKQNQTHTSPPQLNPSTVFFFPQNLLVHTDFSHTNASGAVENQPLSSYFRICQPYGLIIYNMKSLDIALSTDSHKQQVAVAMNNAKDGIHKHNSIRNANNTVRPTAIEADAEGWGGDTGRDLTMHTVSRKGLLETTDSQALAAIDELSYSLCAVAYRTAMLGIFTTLKEGII